MQAQKKTGLNDAIMNAVGQIGQQPVVLSVMEFAFIGGSMGAVVGETIARAVDRSLETKRPLIVVSASGGGADDGRDREPDAAGQGVGWPGEDGRGEDSVCVADDGPDNGRGDGELCDAGGFEYRRAGGADRVCGAAG